jgi:glycosyltransferase involved in cell wall biosynthesis
MPHDDSLRAALGVAPGEVFVLAFGRMVEKKGFRTLIDAAARVPGIRVVIAGGGDLRQTLAARTSEIGAPVSFPGSLDRATMAAAIAAADIVAVPSVVDRAGNVDGLPNALLEALSAGRAVIASRVAGIPDVVDDGVNGLLVPEKDVDSLSTGLRRLAAEPGTRRRLGEEARRRAIRDLTWDAAAKAFEECYAEAAALDAR